jgi:AcrR family transcriptional regulator/DNA-binding MarR family transcriptional regulator
MQRSRLLAGAVRAVEELGWSQVTVADITARARVSRRTFYDLFANREDCLLAALKDVAGQVGAELQAAGIDGLPWREGVRMGLWTILCFFDREPALARFCVVQSARGGERVLAYREEILTGLACVIDEGRGGSARAGECPPLTAEGLAGAANGILYTRLLKGRREPLGGLLGELMSLIVLPYLGSAAASREGKRPVPVVSGDTRGGRHLPLDPDPLKDVPMRLTYRTALVLEEVAGHPGVSNRGLADRAGIADEGQISRLLGRLEKLGLLNNTGRGQTNGASNEWTLTSKGQQVERSIRTHAGDHKRAA